MLRSLNEAAQFCDDARLRGRSIGLVPTMGALHEGHGSLIEAAARECTEVVVTIFVNPLQFNDQHDLAAYPATLDADLSLAEAHGATVVVAPSSNEVYPSGASSPLVTVQVGGPALGLEGADRPGHFNGMATVVTKLLASAGTCRAYFGEKDFQQLAVVRTLVAELKLQAHIIGCPISREADGLARSSRNVFLSATGRQAARCLFGALRAGQLAASDGQGAAAIERAARQVIDDEPAATLSYVSLVEETTLAPLTDLATSGTGRLLLAAHIDGVRLIDNGQVTRTSPATR